MTDKCREALAELVACHTEEAGITMSIIGNQADFDAFMERCQKRLDKALAAARAALAQPAEPAALTDEEMADCGMLPELRIEEERRAEWHAEMRRDAFGDKP